MNTTPAFTPQPGRASEWVNAFVDEYTRLDPAGEFDIELLQDDAHVAYAYTDAKRLDPKAAAAAYLKRTDEPWVKETRRIALEHWRQPAQPLSAEDEAQRAADDAWVDACTEALAARFPGYARKHLEAQAIFMAPGDEGPSLTPQEAAANFIMHFKSDGTSMAPF